MAAPVRDKLAGTVLYDFTFGLGDSYGLERDDPYLRVRDEEVGSQRLSDLMGWRIVPAGQTRTILTGFDHVVSAVEIENTGVLAVEDGGKLVLL